MMSIKEKRCYTVQEIQEILNISRPSVYSLLKKGEFHSVFVAGRHLISKPSFDAWLNGYEVEPEGNVSAEGDEDNRTGQTELQQLKNQQETRMPVCSSIKMTNTGSNQEAVKYQEKPEKSFQNLMKAYMMINQARYFE